MPEEISAVKKYRWIRSEKAGKIVEYHNIDDEWTYFTDGSRIANDLIEEYLEEVHDHKPTMLVNNPASITLAQSQLETQDSPILQLFNMQKKNDKIKMPINLSIEVPKKTIYDVIGSSFDELEVEEELEKFIKGQVDMDIMVDIVNQSIKNLIKERYKGSSTRKK